MSSEIEYISELEKHIKDFKSKIEKDRLFLEEYSQYNLEKELNKLDKLHEKYDRLDLADYMNENKQTLDEMLGEIQEQELKIRDVIYVPLLKKKLEFKILNQITSLKKFKEYIELIVENKEKLEELNEQLNEPSSKFSFKKSNSIPESSYNVQEQIQEIEQFLTKNPYRYDSDATIARFKEKLIELIEIKKNLGKKSSFGGAIKRKVVNNKSKPKKPVKSAIVRKTK